MKTRPALFSFLLHVVLLVLAALMIRTAVPSGLGGEPLRRTAVVLATETVDNQTEYLSEQPEKVTDPASDSVTAPSTIPDLPEELTSPTESSTSNDSPSPDLQQFDAGAMTRSGTGASSSLEAEFSQADLAAIAREQRDLRSRGSPPSAVTTSIFGSGPLTGTRFVFLVDRSKSMGAGGLGVLSRARDELNLALKSLGPEHLFQVVAYHQKTVMVERRDMLPATAANARLATDFLDHLAAFGATDHTAGIFSALALQPDVLVLMSDGGYPSLHDGEIGEIVKSAGKRTTIHCLQFGTSDLAPDNGFMERLALQTGGTFRYVDVKTWRNPDSR